MVQQLDRDYRKGLSNLAREYLKGLIGSDHKGRIGLGPEDTSTEVGSFYLKDGDLQQKHIKGLVWFWPIYETTNIEPEHIPFENENFYPLQYLRELVITVENFVKSRKTSPR